MFSKVRFTVAIAVCSFVFAVTAAAQGFNTISGHVFGEKRTPVEDITVELLDDYSRTLARVRTNSTGRYYFERMPAGVYRVRIMPFGTNFREEEVTIQIINITRESSSGTTVIGAFSNEQRDFYLRADRKKQPTAPAETVFAQEIPDNAKQLYVEGIALLADKKLEEGYSKLKTSIEIFPEYYMAIERLGREYIAADFYRAGAILLQRATEINPKSYNAWYGLAYAFYSLNIDDEALKANSNALNLSPASIDALLLAGTLTRRTKDYKESEKFLLKAKGLEKSNTQIHWELALLYGKNLRRFEDAAKELEAILKIKPDHPRAQEFRALIKDFRDKSKRT